MTKAAHSSSVANIIESVQSAGKTLTEEVSRIRRDIADMKSEMDWLRTSQLPKNEAAERVERWVDTQARAAEFPYLMQVASPNAETDKLPLMKVKGPFAIGSQATAGGQVVGYAETNVGPLLCALLGNELKVRLRELFESMDYEAGPPAADRVAMLSELEQQTEVLEREEEELIETAEALGLYIARRDDCDPRIVLNYRED